MMGRYLVVHRNGNDYRIVIEGFAWLRSSALEIANECNKNFALPGGRYFVVPAPWAD